MKYNVSPLGDAIELVIDHRGLTPKKLGGDWSNYGYRALSAKNIKTGKIVQKETIRYINPQMYKRWMPEEVERNDIFVTSEAPFGEIYLWDSDEKIVLSQRIFGLRVKKSFDPVYMFYYMCTNAFQGELSARASGTTVTGLRQPELLKCLIRYPDLSTQKKIGDILRNIDKKIQTNNEINDNLSKQIQAAIAHFLPYSPDEQKLGWEKVNLSNIASFISGYSYKGSELVDNPESAMATIKNFERNGGFKIDGFKEIEPSSKLKPQQVAELFDTLVAHTDLTQNAEVIGNAEVLLTKSKYKNIVFSMDLVKVLPKLGFSKFLLGGLLQDKRFKEHCLGYVNGTTVLHLSKDALPAYELLLPVNRDNLVPLAELLKSLYLKLAENIDENIRLEELRDSLLPKLMSGEIDVDLLDL